MKRLLEDYKRRLETLNEELRATINEATDLSKINRLSVIRACWKTFIAELEQIVPPEKPIDPKILEAERLEKEEAERKYIEERDAFNNKLLKDEDVPSGF